MADEPQDTDQPYQEPTAPKAQRRPSPAAAAASRARRIGGRPIASGAPTASPGGPGAVMEGDTEPKRAGSAEPVPKPDPATSLTKKAPAAGAKAGSKPAAPAASVVTEVPAWLRWAPAAVLLVGAVTMIVLIATFSHSVWYAKPSASSVRDQVLAQAKTCTVAANSYKYTTIAKDEAAGAKCTTGAQTGRYKRAMETVIKPKAISLKASQVAQINDAAVETISDDGKQWTVILYGQLKIVTSDSPQPRIDPFAAVVRMDKVGGKWLLATIDTVAPGA